MLSGSSGWRLEEGRGSPPCELCSFSSPFYSLLYSLPSGVEMGNLRNIWVASIYPAHVRWKEKTREREKGKKTTNVCSWQRKAKDEKREEELFPKTVPSLVRFRKATVGEVDRSLKTGRRKKGKPTCLPVLLESLFFWKTSPTFSSQEMIITHGYNFLRWWNAWILSLDYYNPLSSSWFDRLFCSQKTSHLPFLM